MNSKNLIAPEFPVLSLDDSGERALRIMSEYRVFHLPLIQRDNYLALISEDDLLDWDTPEQPLSLAEFLTFRPAVVENAHPFEAIKLARLHNLSVLPVVNKQNHFAGVITQQGLMDFMTNNQNILATGGIVVIEMEQRNYSLVEIARICESNQVSILGVSMGQPNDQGLLQITLKVNSTDVQSLVSTFERFNYVVVDTFSAITVKQDVQENYDALMHFMNL